MPMEISWYYPQRVVYMRLYGDLTIEDVRESSQAVGDHVFQGTPLVHVVSDLRDVRKFPTNITQIARTVKPIDNSVIGYTMIVGLNPVMRFITSAISQVFKSRYRTVSTIEEALAFLVEVDATLRDIPAYSQAS